MSFQFCLLHFEGPERRLVYDNSIWNMLLLRYPQDILGQLSSQQLKMSQELTEKFKKIMDSKEEILASIMVIGNNNQDNSDLESKLDIVRFDFQEEATLATV